MGLKWFLCVAIYSWFLFTVGQVNLALFRPASQSSTYSINVASVAVDGNTTDDDSCSITGYNDFQPWWKVQLANPTWVTHVELTNRRFSGDYSEHWD